MSLKEDFQKSLVRSRAGFIGRLNALFRKGGVDRDFYDELEEILLSGDVGVQTTLKLVEQLEGKMQQEGLKGGSEARRVLLDLITSIMEPAAGQGEPVPPAEPVQKPHVILLVGVNGSGKTTSAAKLANLYKKEGKNVLLVAGDTFRAAAVDQLETWSHRAGVEMIRQQQGSDPSALFFDALNAARTRGTDLMIGDTAGRLHNKYNLMEELKKIHRVIGRNLPGAPQQVLLVVDATTGQNAVAQTASFNEALPLTGLVLAKLDGTARGGIVVGIQDSLKIPVRYIGTGEKIDDIAAFDPAGFARALLED